MDNYSQELRIGQGQNLETAFGGKKKKKKDAEQRKYYVKFLHQ